MTKILTPLITLMITLFIFTLAMSVYGMTVIAQTH